MTKIIISNLRPVGSELFYDSESFLNDLTDADLNLTHGGCQFTFSSGQGPFSPFSPFIPKPPFPGPFPGPFTGPIFLA